MKTDALAYCVTKYAEAARLASLRGLSVIEMERDAYARGDRVALALIYSSEEEFEPVVSPEHEAMIDDRNRLRDALQECTDRMRDAVDQLDTFNDADERLADGVALEIAPAFHDAISDAEAALEQCDEQINDTLADKLAKMTAERDDLRREVGELAKSRQLADAVRFVVRSYTTLPGSKPAKTSPKWAAHLLATLTRLEKQ